MAKHRKVQLRSFSSEENVTRFYWFRREEFQPLDEFLEQYSRVWAEANWHGVTEIEAILHLIPCLPSEWQDWAEALAFDLFDPDFGVVDQIDPVEFIRVISDQYRMYAKPPPDHQPFLDDFVFDNPDHQWGDAYNLEPDNDILEFLNIDPLQPDTPDYSNSSKSSSDLSMDFPDIDPNLMNPEYYFANPDMLRINMDLYGQPLFPMLNPIPLQVYEASSSRPLDAEGLVEDEPELQPLVGITSLQPIKHDQLSPIVNSYLLHLERCVSYAQPGHAIDQPSSTTGANSGEPSAEATAYGLEACSSKMKDHADCTGGWIEYDEADSGA